MHNPSNSSREKSRPIQRNEFDPSIKVFNILAHKSRRNSPPISKALQQSVIAGQKKTYYSNLSSRVRLSDEKHLSPKQAKRSDKIGCIVSNRKDKDQSDFKKKRAEQNVSPQSTHHNVARDHSYVQSHNLMRGSARGSFHQDFAPSSKLIQKLKPAASAATTPKQQKVKLMHAQKQKFMYIPKRGPKLSSKHMHQQSLIGNHFQNKPSRYGAQMVYSLQHSRANSNDYSKLQDISAQPLELQEPPIKQKFNFNYSEINQQRSPDTSQTTRREKEEETQRYQTAKIVSEMAALEQLKRKLYGLKRNQKQTKQEHSEFTLNKSPGIRQPAYSQQITPRCSTPITKGSASNLRKGHHNYNGNNLHQSAQNSPHFFQRNYSNIMDLTSRFDQNTPSSSIHQLNKTGNIDFGSRNPSNQGSPNLRYSSNNNSPPSKFSQRTPGSSKFLNNHNLMPAPQFLSKARDEAIARKRVKQGALGISQFLNTNFMKSPTRSPETSNSPSTRTAKLSQLISFLRGMESAKGMVTSPKSHFAANNKSSFQKTSIPRKQSAHFEKTSPKGQIFHFYPSQSQIFGRNTSSTNQKSCTHASSNKLSLRDYLSNSQIQKPEQIQKTNDRTAKLEDTSGTSSIRFENGQLLRNASQKLEGEDLQNAKTQQIYKLNGTKSGPMNVSINNNITNIHIGQVNFTPEKGDKAKKQEEFNIRGRRGVSLDPTTGEIISKSPRINNPSSSRCSPKILYSRNLPQNFERDQTIRAQEFEVADQGQVQSRQKQESESDGMSVPDVEAERKYSVIHSKSRRNMPSLEPSHRGHPKKNLYPIMHEQTGQSTQHSRKSSRHGSMERGQMGVYSSRNHGELYENGLMDQREKLIKFIRLYIAKHKQLPPTTLDYYKINKLIGKGAFGKVTLATHKLTGKLVAIKTIDKTYMKDDFSRRKVMQEVYILKKIRHPNVIRLLEVFESPKHFLMVMQYANDGDLLQYVKRKRRLSESVAKFIFKQIVYGLAHIHTRSVLHRDIKLDNILIDSNDVIKICDFGVSKIIRRGAIINEQCGTPAYIAPEIIADEGYEGFFVDIWSLGVLLFAMLSGTVPFKAPNMSELHELILRGEFEFPVPISVSAQKLIRGMLQKQPTERLTFSELLASPWLRDCAYGQGLEEDFEMSLKGQLLMQNKLSAFTRNKQSGGGNINFLDIENLFYSGNYSTKLTGADYYNIFQGEQNESLDSEALKVAESFGYPREMLVKSLKKGEISHATTTYYLLTR